MRLIKNKRYSNESKKEESKVNYTTLEIISPLKDKVEEKIKEDRLKLKHENISSINSFGDKDKKNKDLVYFLDIACTFSNEDNKSIEEIIEEFGIKENEIQKYESVWYKINSDFEGMSYNKPTFAFTLDYKNSDKSDIEKVINENNELIISPELNVFYDLVVYGVSRYSEEIKIKKIPHFAIPAIMKFLAEIIIIEDVEPIGSYRDDDDW
ncbi:MAG: hypothetical protein QXF12_00135 [Candidatus Aenigmatarchaeota archaeon]